LSLTLREKEQIFVENKVLKGHMEAIMRKREKLYNEELRDLNSSPNNIRLMELRSLRLIGNAARRGKMKNAYKILVDKTCWKYHLEEKCLDEKMIIIKLI
jgi:hypothetical protein